jgi:colanic acid/amylovoran biosynthesis glycosyltransferase
MMITGPIHVLYVAAQFPKQSETFVYREVVGLGKRSNMKISVASVHEQQQNIGELAVDALTREVIPIYPPGKVELLKDAARELLRLSGLRTLCRGIIDAIIERDVPLKKRPKVMWQCLAGLSLAARVRGRGIDHLHAHMAHVPTTIAMYAAMALGVSFSFTGHAADLFKDRCLLQAKLRRARRVMCISHWHRRFYKQLSNLPDESLPVVRCGVEIEKSVVGEISHRYNILAVGRLVPKKGFDVLIRSVARLRDEGMPVSCTIVGDGPQMAMLMALTKELNLQTQVSLKGAQSNTQVRELMRVHDVFALPCRIDQHEDRDGIPVVLIEAMASGVAVVSGDLPTIRELIADGVNGLLVPSDDVVALAGALRGLLSDACKRAELGKAANRRVRDEFSLDLNLDRLERALRTDQTVPVSTGVRNEWVPRSSPSNRPKTCK